MGKRYPAGIKNILLTLNIPIRGTVKSTDNPAPCETKEWEVIPQFAC